jgi:hypothetical protein
VSLRDTLWYYERADLILLKPKRCRKTWFMWGITTRAFAIISSAERHYTITLFPRQTPIDLRSLAQSARKPLVIDAVVIGPVTPALSPSNRSSASSQKRRCRGTDPATKSCDYVSLKIARMQKYCWKKRGCDARQRHLVHFISAFSDSLFFHRRLRCRTHDSPTVIFLRSNILSFVVSNVSAIGPKASSLS